MLQLRRLMPLAAVAALLCASLALAHGSKRAQTQARLKAVQTRIGRVAAQVKKDLVDAHHLTLQLRDAEAAVGKARDRLDALHKQQAQHAARRAQLAAKRQQLETRLAGERKALAGQLRAAYMIGHEEPLKLLLNQQDPARAGRMFTYYGYFGRARAGRISAIDAAVQHLGQVDQALAAEQQHLAALAADQSAQLASLKQAQAQRADALAHLKAITHTRRQTLARLKGQRAALTKLLQELRRAQRKYPVGNQAFAKLRGKLTWPVAGRVLARFGQTRAGGVKWDGVLIASKRGTPVHAVYGGRVIFADWLPGLGLLTIIDHGGGYISLYGHNERLYKGVGAHVNPGDVIAAVGDTGGSSRPELYFEIRRHGKPINPRPWFKTSLPGS